MGSFLCCQATSVSQPPDMFEAAQWGETREEYDYRYVVKVTNSSEDSIAVDICVPPSEENAPWNNGIYGRLLKPGVTEHVAIPDFKWKGWGGPFRVLKHQQDHPVLATVRRFDKPASETFELRPGSHLLVTADGVTAEHDVASKEALWTAFVAEDKPSHERYNYKYAFDVVNTTDDFAWIDVLVPEDSRDQNWSVGIRGICLNAGEKRTIVVSDWSWLEQKGPFVATMHIQDHPVAVSVRLDRDGTSVASAPKLVTPRSVVTIAADGSCAVAAAE